MSEHSHDEHNQHPTMNVTGEAVKASETYAADFKQDRPPMPPARKMAVVACMDARLMPDQILGLKTGYAYIIRNAGGIVTEDVLRSLIISHHLLGTEEFIIMNHTDCGMLKFKDEELQARLEKETGVAPTAPMRFHAFSDLETNVKQQVQRVKSHPWIPNDIPVRGFIYDVKTGGLTEVLATASQSYKSDQDQSATF